MPNLFARNHSFIKNLPSINIKPGFCPYTRNWQTPQSKQNLPALLLTGSHGTLTVHSRYYPVNEAQKLVDAFNADTDTIVVLGLGLGYHILPLVNKFASKQIIVIEPDKHLFNLFLQQNDLSQWPRLPHFIVGYNEFETAKFASLGKQFTVFDLPPLQRVMPSYWETTKKLITGAPLHAVSKSWHYPRFKTEKLKVLFLLSGYVLAKECISALKELGHQVEIINLEQIMQDLAAKEEAKGLQMKEVGIDYQYFVRNLLELIAKFKPDFVLTINHLGFDREGRLTSLLSELELPWVSWFVDSPNVVLSSHKTNISPFCSLFVWDNDYAPQLRQWGYPYVDYLPLATMPQLFKPVDLPQRYQVAFVGSSMVYAVHKNLKSVVHRPDLLAALEPIANRFLQLNTRHVEQAIESLKQEGLKVVFDDRDQQEDFYAAVLWRATQIYRLSGLQQLADFYPGVHGDPNWDRILDNRYRLGREIDYYSQMPSFYNSAAIQFNMTSRQMPQAVNQRVFDVPACNRFILTDNQPQLAELFEPGQIVSFNQVEEIPELVNYYLNHPQERQKIAQAGYNQVLKHHTYKHRLQKMIEVLRERYR